MVDWPRKRKEYTMKLGDWTSDICGGQAKGRNVLHLLYYSGSVILSAGKGISLYQWVRLGIHERLFISGSYSGKTLIELVFQETHCTKEYIGNHFKELWNLNMCELQ
jgi:hypothetical protein